MATINVKDSAGSTVALEKPLTPGRAAAASSRPITLSTEDKTALDAVATETTLAAMNAKIPATPATTGGQATANASLASIDTKLTSQSTAANQTTGNTSLSTIAGAVSSAKMAVKAASGDFADGSINTLGSRTDAKSTATDTTSVSGMQVLKQISASVQAATPAGTNHLGKVQIGDGTNNAAVRAGSSAAVIGDAAVVVVNRPDSLADPFAQYEYVAASATTQALGATGATGDYLAGVLIYPATAAAGAVSIKDGSNTAITVFAGGGTTALPTLAPIPVPLGIYSVSGAWQITTGTNVSAMGIGKFT